jgi:hypothetical protein
MPVMIRDKLEYSDRHGENARQNQRKQQVSNLFFISEIGLNHVKTDKTIKMTKKNVSGG